MLAGSEFRLRRGLACGKTLVRRKSAAGQKADGVAFHHNNTKSENIGFNRPLQNREATALAVASLFWVVAAGGDLYPLALQGSGRVKALPAAKCLYGVPAPLGGGLLERRQDPHHMGGLEVGIGDFPQNRKMEFVRLRQRCEIERQNT